MKQKYEKCGLNYDLIVSRYPNLSEYEEWVNAYFADEFFKDMKTMLQQEDYALAKDAAKGLYILASELCLYPLYEALLEIYEDLQYEQYQQVMAHYYEMIEVYERIRNVFNA